MNDDTLSFIGVAPCGCIKMAVVDAPDSKSLTTREVGKMVRSGLRVEHIPTPEVRTRPWKCEEHRQPVTAPKPPPVVQGSLFEEAVG